MWSMNNFNSWVKAYRFTLCGSGQEDGNRGAREKAEKVVSPYFRASYV